MNDFVDTYPALPHRFDAETVQRLRSTTACDDKHQPEPAEASTHYGMDDQRHDEGAGAFVVPVVIALALISALCIAAWLGNTTARDLLAELL